MSEVSESLDSLRAFCTAEDRLVPKPSEWSRLYGLLKNTRRNGTGGWDPPLPLILGAWHDSSPEEKQRRFEEHLRWAQEQDQPPEVGTFLRALPEEDWCHTGEC